MAIGTGKNLEIDSKVMILYYYNYWFFTDRNTRIRFYSDDILLLCRFVEIGKLEFDSTVMKLY